VSHRTLPAAAVTAPLKPYVAGWLAAEKRTILQLYAEITLNQQIALYLGSLSLRVQSEIQMDRECLKWRILILAIHEGDMLWTLLNLNE
jgi:hypothetical protein